MPVALGRSPYWIGGILGGPFLFEGEVVVGDRRGRELGVPTAKIVPGDALVSPGHGAYAAWRTSGGERVRIRPGPAGGAAGTGSHRGRM
jgi:riboflavin kinase/FMN adenylyltransferase